MCQKYYPILISVFPPILRKNTTQFIVVLTILALQHLKHYL